MNGAAVAGTMDVQKGEYVHLVATPTGANAFNGWENGEGETVSDAADCWLCVEDATSLTATWRTVDTHSFTWNWNVSEGDWNDPANWYYEGVVPATTYPNDAEADYATFTTPATVTLTGDAAVKEAWFNANVTLTGGTLTTTLAATYDNSGKVTLSNAGFANLLGADLVIDADIVMTAETTNWFNTVANADWGKEILINGNISGYGCYQLNLAKYRGCGVKVNGNNNDFHGDVYTTGGADNRSRIWWGENAMSTNAYVHLGHSYRNVNDKNNAGLMGNAISVGGYNGVWYDTWDGVVLTIGYLNRDSSLSIYNYVSGRANSVAKVGNANLTLGTTTIKNLTVSEGSVTMPVGIAPQTLTIATGAEIILAGDASWQAGTVTNLFSYTTLAGTGAAAFPSQVEVTGLADGLDFELSVKENTVVATIVAAAPVTDDVNAVISKDAETGSYTIATEAETLSISIPDGVTVGEVVVSPATKVVTGMPDGAALKVVVAWDGGKADYAIVKLADGGAVVLDEDAVVMVGDEQIPLKPVLSDASDEVLPFIASGSAVDVGVKAIHGLTYRLLRGGSLESINTPVAECQATSSRVSLQDKTHLPSAAFYCVGVDLQ